MFKAPQFVQMFPPGVTPFRNQSGQWEAISIGKDDAEDILKQIDGAAEAGIPLQIDFHHNGIRRKYEAVCGYLLGGFWAGDFSQKFDGLIVHVDWTEYGKLLLITHPKLWISPAFHGVCYSPTIIILHRFAAALTSRPQIEVSSPIMQPPNTPGRVCGERDYWRYCARKTPLPENKIEKVRLMEQEQRLRREGVIA